MVANYRLSPATEASLAAIAIYTDDTFGRMQTAAYAAGLEASFNLLVNFPGIGVAVFEIKPGLRRYRYQSHYIFYSQHSDSLLIEDVIHVHRNIRRDLFDT